MYAQKLTRQPGDGGQPVAWPLSHPWRLAVACFFLIVVQLMFVIEGAGRTLGADALIDRYWIPWHPECPAPRIQPDMKNSGSDARAFTAVAGFLSFLAFMLLLSGFGSIEGLLAPGKNLWPRWTVDDSASTVHIDHAAWSAFLQKYLVVGKINRLRYARVTADDRHRLDSYIDGLAALPISRYSRREQLAYWINLYNAVTVRLVLEHYPVHSIRDIDISPGLLAPGPWDKNLIVVEGQRLTLNDIEHRILRPIWNDPRLHYVLNCAAQGCPNLLPQAFAADDADRLLDQAARSFINTRAVRIKRGKLIVSSIYDWFREDFGGSEVGVLEHLRRYARPPLTKQLEDFQKIDGTEYDWRLNDAGQP